MDEMNPSLEASLDDLKVIYRVLGEHFQAHPELAQNGFYLSLRRLLEAQAEAEGVDVSDDEEWTAWLLDVADPTDPENRRDLLN
ncbi:MAG TPA: hypothetical protein DEF51_20980 [Myxococcales bacterium]|nr:hypothetical protein [Myxococcales bacterium]